MKKMYVTLGIPFEYCECHWLLSPIRREKDGLPLREEIKWIKVKALARPIAVMEPAVNEGGKKDLPCLLKRCWLRKSQRLLKGLLAAAKLVIDLTSPKGEKDEAARSVPVTPIVPKVAS
ncbi:hypothetical protein COP2_013388 [Malus domestica]